MTSLYSLAFSDQFNIIYTLSTEMVKRTFIVCTRNAQQYKLYTDDVKTINRRIKKSTPKVPPYDADEHFKKWEENT